MSYLVNQTLLLYFILLNVTVKCLKKIKIGEN